MAARRRPGGSGDLDLVRGGGGGFRYNARLGMALLPSAVLMLGMGGKTVLGTLTVGLMLSYILDSLMLKRGAFFGVWGSLGATGVAYALNWGLFLHSPSSSWPLQALALLVLMQLIFLLGVWASLQFRWLYLENPSVVVALERLLFACTPFVAATCQTWGIVAAVGLEHAAFYLLPIQCLLYWLFSIPRNSSFRAKTERNYGGSISEASLIMGPLEACLHTLVLLFLPLLLHVGIHHRKLLSSTNLACELVLLFFLPLLFQLAASTRGALWWLTKDEQQLRHLRLVNGAISAVAVVLALEVRVVFYAFNQYIQVPPPWNYLLVTAACLCGVAAGGFCLVGGVDHFLLTALFLLATVPSALVVGMPLKFLPAPVVAATFLAHYISTRNLLSYMVCVASASVSLTWFIVHHFWSLNIWVGAVPLQSTCKLILASAVVAMSTPGLTATFSSGKARHFTDTALAVHAILISILENRLYNNTSIYFFGDEDVVYPSYMVVATTAVGLLITQRMKAGNRISALGYWLLTCLYGAKLSMLVLSSSKDILWESSLLLLAVSPPILLYNDRVKGASRMKPWQGFGHAAVIFALVWICKGGVSDAIQWWSGRHPSGSLLLGAVLLLSALASAPIVVYHFNHIQHARKALVLVMVAALLLILLQPPLPRALSSVNVAQYWMDDDVVYGTDSGPGWSTWLLLLTALTSLAALTSVLPVRHSVFFRLVYAVGLGLCVGVYLCVEHFPGGLIMHALLIGAITCASVILLFVLLPSEFSPRFVPWQFALLVALLPVLYMLEGLQYGDSRYNAAGEEEDEEGKLLLSVLALQGAHAMLLGVYAAIFMLIALVIKLQLTSILKEKQQQASFVPKHRLLQQQQQQQQHQQRSSLGFKKLAAEGSWMPAVGNVATLLCFVLCMIVNYHVAGGSHRAILLVAPVLLLLNQDSNLLAGFGDRQRYFPLSAAVSLYLTLAAAYELWAEVWPGGGRGGGGLFFAAKNTLLLLLTLPGHAHFNVFMWNYVTRPSSSQLLLLLVAPLNVPALVATDVNPIRALALLAILYALVQYAISRHLRIAGMKYV